MEIKDIQKLIKMLEGTDVKEISLEQDGFKIKLLRDIKTGEMLETNINSKEIQTNKIVIDSKKNIEKKVEQNIDYIRASMPGTFYRKPSPDAKPYVKEGDIVNQNTVVCIIEAMKIFNEIKAGISGKITKILVEDGEGIEYAQPLFEVEKL